MQHKDADLNALQSFLALAHDLVGNEVHALAILREDAVL